MKRTRLERKTKNASSAAPQRFFTTKSDSSERPKTEKTVTNSNKLSFENLKRNQSVLEKSKTSTGVRKKKLRGTVDLEMMKEELKELEDPPVSQEEQEISSKKLPYSFFNVPCVDLAKKLLGKILVRRLENGTVLKGRIVETEAYVGELDKASQTYQGKVTPRNLPMYMPPGTIYVYVTYGMYHCFNISSEESDRYVLIRALEVLGDTEYVELLRNSESKIGKSVKKMSDDLKRIEPRELCNEPWKICTAFAIDVDDLNKKNLWNSDFAWLEDDECLETFLIVEAPVVNNFAEMNTSTRPLSRYYVLGNPCVGNRNVEFEHQASAFQYVVQNFQYCKGCAVLLRALEPLEGVEEMRNLRTARQKSHKKLANHEICNGPSKLCIALEIDRGNCKYSICNYKSMWIESDDNSEDSKIVTSTRIGIDSAGDEWASKPLRFYILGNASISKRDKKAEGALFGND